MSEEKKTVLIIDDEDDILEYLTALFGDHGYKTLTAKDGKQAMAVVRSTIPDLVTLDVTMPEKSGVRTYRELKEDEKLKSIPVIIVTGVSDDFQRFISTRRQIPPPDGYISKPIDEKKILDLAKKLAG